MRRPDQASRDAQPDLPADDLPSAEVLDELLRAFSADTADEQTLAEVDLGSPEVAELLAPTSPTPPPPSPAEPPPQPDPEDPRPAVEVEPEPVAPSDVEAQVEADQDEPPPVDPAPEVDGSTATRTIRIDASNDPPDAVYLAAGDPLLAASAGGQGLRAAPAPATDGAPAAPVFIDDAAVEAGETITIADASTATRIEPRMRERRIAVKRAAGRKRLRWALVAAVVAVVVVAVLAVLGSSLFAIDDVRVQGAVQTDAEQLQAVVDDLDGTPVLRADTDEAERALEAIPWVADARVTTQFPHGATIELRERTPVATYQGPDGRFRVIDIDGRVLDVVDAQPVEHLPITSADAIDLEPGQFAAQGFIAAANLVQALTPELRAVATSATVTGNGSDLRLELTDGREARFGPGRELVVKLVRLQTKLDQLAGAGFQYVDVSTDDVTTG